MAMACFFPDWVDESNCTPEIEASCTGWSMFASEDPDAVIGTLRVLVDRAVGIERPGSFPVVKISYKSTGEHFGGTRRAAPPKREGTYVWDEEVGAELRRSMVRPGGRVALLVFVKEGRRNSFHAHHDSLAGHVLDVSCDEVFHEQLGGWVERRLKLTPRGYLMTRLRFEKAETYAPSGVALEGPLTALERHVRESSPRNRDRVDEAAFRSKRRTSSRASSSSVASSTRGSITSADGSTPKSGENVLFVTEPSGER